MERARLCLGNGVQDCTVGILLDTGINSRGRSTDSQKTVVVQTWVDHINLFFVIVFQHLKLFLASESIQIWNEMSVSIFLSPCCVQILEFKLLLVLVLGKSCCFFWDSCLLDTPKLAKCLLIEDIFSLVEILVWSRYLPQEQTKTKKKKLY